MNLLRLPALAIVLAAAVFSISQDGAAGGLNIVSITIEPDWEGGYMGLGGGLVKSIVKSDDDKPAISRRRPRHVRATQKFDGAIWTTTSPQCWPRSAAPCPGDARKPHGSLRDDQCDANGARCADARPHGL